MDNRPVDVLCEQGLYKYLGPHFRQSHNVQLFELSELEPTFRNLWRFARQSARQRTAVHLNTLHLAGQENFIAMTRFRVLEATSWSPVSPQKGSIFRSKMGQGGKKYLRLMYFSIVALFAKTIPVRYHYHSYTWIGSSLSHHKRGTVKKLTELPKCEFFVGNLLLELGDWNEFPYTELDIPTTVERICEYLRPYEPIFLKRHPSWSADASSHFKYTEIDRSIPVETCVSPESVIFFGYPSSALQFYRKAVCLEVLYVFKSESARLAHQKLLLDNEKYMQAIGVANIRYAELPRA